MNWLFAQPFDSILSSRIILIVVIALAVSAALAGVFWFTLGRTRAAGLGYAGIPVGFLTGFVLFLGPPPLMSGEPLHILPYIVLLGLVAGATIDIASSVDSFRLATVLVWPAVAIVGIGWREMPEFATFSGLPMAVLWLAAVINYLWLGTNHPNRSTPLIVLLAISVGLGVVAFIGGSKILTVLGAILAASIAGMLVWSWPNARFPVGGVANLGAGGSALALAVAEVLYSKAATAAVATLMLLLAMPALAQRLPLGRNFRFGPIVLLVVCAIPIAAAAAVALRAKGVW